MKNEILQGQPVEHGVTVRNGTRVFVDSKFKVGDIVKFSYKRNKRGEEEDLRRSYSKITRVIPKIDKDNFICIGYLTENEKFISDIMIEEKVS